MISLSKIIYICIILLLISTSSKAGDFLRESEINPYSAYHPQKLIVSGAPPPGPSLHSPDTAWIESTLASMTLDEKIGQMLIVWYNSVSDGYNQITSYHVGGFIFSQKNSQQVFDAVSSLQAKSYRPLWFAADFEAGTGARIFDGTSFPLNMGMGAANDTALMEQYGRSVAREARSMGVQIGFGPVVDVNSYAFNPIISTRSYSDNPELVAKLAKYFIQGARAEGMLCTLKHYPGHGGTTGDSHTGLPIVSLSRQELMDVHIKPYSLLLQDTSISVDMVMTAHVWYPALDPGSTAWPATLSTTAIKQILRDELNYNGIVITDSFGMAGLQSAAATPQAAVDAIQAGVDIILMPPTTSDVFSGIYSALSSGSLSMSRIDESVRRILRAKSMVGLPSEGYPTQWIKDSTIGNNQHHLLAQKAAQESFTKLKFPSQSMALRPWDKTVCLVFNATSYIFYLKSSDYFVTPLKTNLPMLDIITVGTNFSSSQYDQILSSATSNYDKIIIASYDWCSVYSSSQKNLINALCATQIPITYVSFGSPYHYLQFPNVDAFYCAYCSQEDEQAVAAEVLSGTYAPIGILPVELFNSGIDKDIWTRY